MKTMEPSTALCIYLLLKKHSDPEHLLTQEDIIAGLEEEYAIFPERKAVSRQIDKIRAAGIDIVRVGKAEDPKKRGGYYLDTSDELTEAQWQIIAGAVSAASFVTESEAREMHEKIAGYVNEHTAMRLKAASLLQSEKTANPEVIETITLLETAILQARPVYFRYVDYYWNNTPHYHRTDQPRHAVPCAAKWENDRFYLIGYLLEDDVLYPAHPRPVEERIFRVDKMENVRIDETGTCDPRRMDAVHFADQKIGLYAGEKRLVKCAANENALRLILDRFGEKTNEVRVRERKNDSLYPLEVSFTVEVSPVFFGWMTTLRGNAKILSPKAVAEEYLAMAETIASIYRD